MGVAHGTDQHIVFLLCFDLWLLLLPSGATISSLSRGKSILHRLNRPRNGTSTRPAMPVFNYGGSNFIGRESELSNGNSSESGDDVLDLQRQMMTALPDLSDPCFRRYTNSIIVNAQPYERRSSISLIHCKLQCLRSQLGLYSCRSFVYDNVNQVCDLFAHVGDQAPAKLLRFQTRDYFEPTAAIHCVPPNEDQQQQLGSSAMGVQQTQVPPAVHQSNPIPTLVPGPIVWPTPAPLITAGASTVSSPPSTLITDGPSTTEAESEREEPEEEETATGLTLLKPAEEGGGTEEDEDSNEELQQRLEGAKQHSNSDANGQRSCLPGQVPRFLRTKDFELFGQDEHRMTGMSEQRCLDLCASNSSSGAMSGQCNSLEFTASLGECVFSAETAVPVGNGQLRQRPGTDYLERVCVDQRLANECRNSIYRRFPQMILVGFAETVVDSVSLQQCLDNCLNSQQLYGFRCSSGMFYFEEPQLNCILNTEDRETQPDLFTTETSDLVDYFETGCEKAPRLSMLMAQHPQQSPSQNAAGAARDYEEETNAASAEGNGLLKKRALGEPPLPKKTLWKEDHGPGSSNNSKNSYNTMDWAGPNGPFARPEVGGQRWASRWRVCAGGRVCGKEERQCILASAAGRKASGHSGGPKAAAAMAAIAAQNNRAERRQAPPRREQRRVAAAATIGTATKVQLQQRPQGARPSVNGTSQLRNQQVSAEMQQQQQSSAQRGQPRKCQSEECCPLLGSCRLGIRFGSQGKGANWCKNPCG